jgi:phage gp29-like protein
MKKAFAKYFNRFRKSQNKKRQASLYTPGQSDDFDEFLSNWLSHTNTKLTASFIKSMLEGADEGYPQDQAALFQVILEKEPVIAAHFQTRLLGVLACDWHLTKSPSTPENRIAELTGLLENADVYGLLKHLLSAIAVGYSGSAVLWGEGGGEIEGFKHINSTNWIFDQAGNPALLTLDGQERPLNTYHPNQFVFHTCSLKPGIPSRGGLLRALVWLYFFKHYALRDRARYLERFGIPFVIAKIRRDDFEDTEIKSGILNSLAKIGSDGVGVVTEGSDIEVLDTGAKSGSEFQDWFNYIDEVYALMILGQVASSKAASGFSKGQMQENVRRDLLEADCRGIMQTVTKQLLRPLEKFKYGNDSGIKFKLDFEPADDLKLKAEIINILESSGHHKIDPAYIEKIFDMPLQKQDKE